MAFSYSISVFLISFGRSSSFRKTSWSTSITRLCNGMIGEEWLHERSTHSDMRTHRHTKPIKTFHSKRYHRLPTIGQTTIPGQRVAEAYSHHSSNVIVAHIASRCGCNVRTHIVYYIPAQLETFAACRKTMHLHRNVNEFCANNGCKFSPFLSSWTGEKRIAHLFPFPVSWKNETVFFGPISGLCSIVIRWRLNAALWNIGLNFSGIPINIMLQFATAPKLLKCDYSHRDIYAVTIIYSRLHSDRCKFVWAHILSNIIRVITLHWMCLIANGISVVVWHRIVGWSMV